MINLTITQIRLNILGEYVYLQDLEDYLLTHKLPLLDVKIQSKNQKGD